MHNTDGDQVKVLKNIVFFIVRLDAFVDMEKCVAMHYWSLSGTLDNGTSSLGNGDFDIRKSTGRADRRGRSEPNNPTKKSKGQKRAKKTMSAEDKRMKNDLGML
jgi:hypothetical protein